MDKIEKLREILNDMILKESNRKDIINVSRKLDREIVKFIKYNNKEIVNK